MKHGDKFSGLMMVYGIAALLYSVQMLFSLHEMSPGLQHSLWILLYGPVLFWFNLLFLRRERTVTQTVFVNGAIMVLALLVLFCCFGTGGGKQAVVTLSFYLFLTYYSVRLNLNAPRENQLILTLDISVVMLIVLVAVLTAVEVSLYNGLPVVVGSVCVLLGLMRFRLHSLRLWTVPAVLLLLVICVFGGLMALAKPIGSLLTTVFSDVISGLKYIGGQIERLLRYLTSFLKAESYEEISGDSFGIPSGAMEIAQKFQDGMGIIIGLVILGFFLFVLIMALRILGKSGIGGTKLVSKQHCKNDAPSFFSAFRKMIRTLREKLYYSCLVISHRNTPWGLYYMLLAITGKGSMGLKAGETPREFLLRLSEQLSIAGAELYSLIPDIEQALFSRSVSTDTVQNASHIIWETVKTVRFHR